MDNVINILNANACWNWLNAGVIGSVAEKGEQNNLAFSLALITGFNSPGFFIIRFIQGRRILQTKRTATA